MQNQFEYVPQQLSLRDHFAATAMAAFIQADFQSNYIPDGAIPKRAYDMADAMFEEGKRRAELRDKSVREQYNAIIAEAKRQHADKF